MKQEMVVQVNDLVTQINQVLSNGLNLSGIWIQGEVSGLTKHYSGHYYFTLKDAAAQISCTMWKTYTSRLNFDLQDGMKVLVQGSVSVFARSGKMSLNVYTMRLDGIGSLFLELEQRKQALAKAGYFASEHKKPKPAYMEDIAVVTGKNTAALQDVLKTLKRRWPMSKIHIYPAMVQGREAPASIIKALKKADAGHHDAILLVRGGGSFEDLFCFNDVDLVKTIYDLNTFTITGIGHEIDYTLADYVSDFRAVTPTAAAQAVSWDQNEIFAYLRQEQEFFIRRMCDLLMQAWQQLAYIQNYPYFASWHTFLDPKWLALDARKNALESILESYFDKAKQAEAMQAQLIQAMNSQLSAAKTALESRKNQIHLVSLSRPLEQQAARLAAIEQSLPLSMRQILNLSRSRLDSVEALLYSVSPDAVLARGYARVEQDGVGVFDLKDVKTGKEARIIMQGGSFDAKVLRKEEADGR